MLAHELLKTRPWSVEDALRVRLAARVDAPPDTLAILARDPSAIVRATVAMNDATPAEAQAVLAADGDERIRAVLARKLAHVLPSLAGPDREHMHAQVTATLTCLVADEAVRVRAEIAETLKEMPDVPHTLILHLARDRAAAVCEPVLRLSPLLSTADLLGLLANPASRATTAAIARRPGLPESVADAIAVASDPAAIRALLENHGAAIREATLDGLIARSAEHGQWHEPLVGRPSLTGRAARALSHIVAMHLLELMAGRADFPPDIRRGLRRRLGERLAESAAPRDGALTLDEAMAEARVMGEEDQLTEQALLDAAGRGERALAAAMLAVAADVPASMVERAAAMRAAKGLVSLVWKAGFSMRAAVTVQMFLAHIAPAAILRPGGTGGFPLAPDEMRWQLEFLAGSER